jgi:hypothetical protein
MQTQTSGRFLLATAIVIAAAMVCATLLVLNVHATYPVQGMTGETYLHLLTSGCTLQTIPGGTPVSVTCPLWVRP